MYGIGAGNANYRTGMSRLGGTTNNSLGSGIRSSNPNN